MFNYIHYPTWYQPEQFKEIFTPDFHIDAVQNLKRNITNAVITDKTLNKAANDYLDAQTAFAKMLSKNALDIAKYGFESVSDKVFAKKAEK